MGWYLVYVYAHLVLHFDLAILEYPWKCWHVAPSDSVLGFEIPSQLSQYWGTCKLSGGEEESVAPDSLNLRHRHVAAVDADGSTPVCARPYVAQHACARWTSISQLSGCVSSLRASPPPRHGQTVATHTHWLFMSTAHTCAPSDCLQHRSPHAPLWLSLQSD